MHASNIRLEADRLILRPLRVEEFESRLGIEPSDEQRSEAWKRHRA